MSDADVLLIWTCPKGHPDQRDWYIAHPETIAPDEILSAVDVGLPFLALCEPCAEAYEWSTVRLENEQLAYLLPLGDISPIIFSVRRSTLATLPTLPLTARAGIAAEQKRRARERRSGQGPAGEGPPVPA